MKLPNQTPSVDRSNRLAATQGADVNPAFLGAAWDLLKKAGKGALDGVMS
jgi:hypothetical protein